MIRRCAITLLLSATVAVMAAGAQTRPVPVQQHEDHERKDQKAPARGDSRHRGEWLRKHQALPLQEQEKALERDPEFRRLPPQEQSRYKEQLREFNRRPPQQREQIIQRMERWDRLSPQQKQRARNVYDRLHDLPEDRRSALRQAARNLSAMKPQDRDQALNSPALRSQFSDSERDTLRDMLDLGINPNRPDHTHQAGTPPH